jgi:hypothetical protein
MSKCKRLKFIIFFLLLFFCWPFLLEGREAKFADLLTTNNVDHILVYGRVTNCFTESMESAILAGVPTTFTFLLDFYQERPNLPDKRLARCVVKNTIKYDNVKKIFTVSSTEGRKSTTFQTFEHAKAALAELNGVAVIPLSALTSSESYYLMVKAQLDKVRLPLHMEYLFFFVSLWDFETDWFMQRIKY